MTYNVFVGTLSLTQSIMCVGGFVSIWHELDRNTISRAFVSGLLGLEGSGWVKRLLTINICTSSYNPFTC